MRKLSCFFVIGILTAATVFVGCKKKPDPTPDQSWLALGQGYPKCWPYCNTTPVTAADTLEVTSTMTTSNGGNSGTALSSLSVTTSTGTAKIRLDVTSTVDLDKIYILKSEDNGALTAMSVVSIITSDNKTFTGGSASYSLNIPSSTKSFVIDIPVSVRTTSTAVSDVYYIWITNGTGDFFKPTKNTVLGPAVVTLNYTAATVISYSSATVGVGTQSAVNSSFLVTSGQVSALSTTDYTDAPGSADIRFVTLDGSGKKNNTSTNVYMYSPNDVTNANPPSDGSAAFVVATGSRTTYFAASTVTATAFANASGTDLQFPTLTTGTAIQVVAGGVYEFQTASGKKGLIKINSLTADTDAAAAGGYNANVSVKVLN